MWVKYYKNGTYRIQGEEQGKTWLTSKLDDLVKVELFLPSPFNPKTIELTGPGPYHHALRCRSVIGAEKPLILSEYLQRYDGQNWLTLEANYETKQIRKYVRKDKI